jgi:hypothetical protein
MSIDSTFLASNYLQNRLNGLSNTEAVSDVNSTINNSSNESVDREFSIAASDSQYLLLKDTVDQYTNHTTLVQISSAALEGVGDYLVQIKEKVSQLESSLLNDPLRVEISSELATLENELSTYLGTSIQSASEKNINISNFSSESETKFFNEVVVNGKFSNAEAQKLAEIEVNFAHGIAEAITAHNPHTCPICSARAEKDASGIAQGFSGSVDSGSNSNPVAIEGATQNNTSVTGASANSTTSNQELDSLMLANKWELSASETVSYSYYQTSGVAYTYNVDASGQGGSTVGTAGLSLLGDSADLEARLDAAFTDWDSVGAWTFEKVTESGSTVGEIRSRELSGVGTPSYSAFAYGPGSSAINGDIWYVPSYGEQMDEGSFNYYTALHEIGHAVGLSHPFDGGGRGGTTLADGKDFVRNTVMSYTSNDRNTRFIISGGTTASPTNLSQKRLYPTDPGMLDVQVIEHMYGTSTDTNLGDTTYSFTDRQFFLKTIVDSGGTDTIDGSSQTEEVWINLNGGTASSIGIWDESEQADYWSGFGFTVTASIASRNSSEASGTHASPFAKGWYTGVDNLQISKSTTIENAKGGAKADTLIGNDADNAFTGNAGNDSITGGGGDDTAVYSGARANYTITDNGGGTYTITDNVGSEGTDTLTSMEFARFSNATVTLATGSTLSNGGDSYLVPDLARSYKPVVRENLSLNVDAFPILAKLNIPQIQAFTRGVATGGFSEIPTAEAKVLFTDGLKTEAEIQSALNALDELLKQIAEQQSVLAAAQTNVNNNFASLLVGSGGTSAEFEAAGVSSSLVEEIESAGFVAALMTEIRAQIKVLVDAQVASITNTTQNEVTSLLS